MAGILLENETQEILDGAQQTSQLVHSELCLLTTSAQSWKSKEILDSERTWDKGTYITSARPPLSYHTHIYIGKYILQKCASVQSLSCVGLFTTKWTAAHQASPSITNSQRLLKLTSIQLVMPFNHLILCHHLLLLPLIFLSIRVFSNESAPRIRWPKYWILSFSISPSNEYSGLISFWID